MAEFKRIEDGDFSILSKWEKQLSCLIHSHYLVGVGHSALEWMQGWWKRYASPRARVNENCADCVASFLKDVGKAYFMEKEAREQAASGSSEKPNTQPAPKKRSAAPRKKKTTSKKSE